MADEVDNAADDYHDVRYDEEDADLRGETDLFRYIGQEVERRLEDAKMFFRKQQAIIGELEQQIMNITAENRNLRKLLAGFRPRERTWHRCPVCGQDIALESDDVELMNEVMNAAKWLSNHDRTEPVDWTPAEARDVFLRTRCPNKEDHEL